MHLRQKMRPAPQIEAEIDQPARQVIRPCRAGSGLLWRLETGFFGLCNSVVVHLDTAVEQVGGGGDHA